MQDKWSRWLLETRFGGDERVAEAGMRGLRSVRDSVLDAAHLAEGETLLDVGCGDGLIAFGALERGAGRVIFSDISRPLLEHCAWHATETEVRERCAFIEASADRLPIADESANVVTTRSVLIFVKDKAAAFREFYRVLRPGGRVSLFEPINRFNETYRPGGWWGESVPEAADLAERLHQFYRRLQPDDDPMMDFDEVDLVRLCEDEGFREVHMELHIDIRPAPPMSWDAAIRSSGNPNIPPPDEAIRRIFSAEEHARYEAHMRPMVEAGGMPNRIAAAYLQAVKSSGPERPGEEA